jgi:hypothetical protein
VESSASALAVISFLAFPPRQNPKKIKGNWNINAESNFVTCLQSRHDISMWVEIIAGVCLAWYVFIAIVCLIGYAQLYGLLFLILQLRLGEN